MKRLLVGLLLVCASPAWAITAKDNTANSYSGSPVAAFNFVYDGATWDRMRGDATDGALVNLGTNNDVTVTSITGGATAHDAAAAAISPMLQGCYASAAAPTGVSADNDAVRQWCLRNGANVVQMSFAGTLASTGAGAVDSGTQRVTLASDSAGIITTGTAGSASATVVTVQGVASMTPVLTSGTGTAGTAASAVTTIQGIASMTPVISTGSGTAGSAATGVSTVQGIASMTPILTTPGSTSGVAMTAATAPSLAIGTVGIYNSTLPSPTTGQTVGVQLDSKGRTRVQLGATGFGEKETIAASQTDQVMGATGGAGDYLSHVTCAPATTSPGIVTVEDGSSTANVAFAGGASSVSNLVPFTITVEAYSVTGAWYVTTGANISCVAVGDFT